MFLPSFPFDVPLVDGQFCAVRVAVPSGPVPAAGWPVAYVLDLRQFDTMRAGLAAPLRAGDVGRPGLLVGLGPGVPEDRAREYVPSWHGRGGAARWLRTLDRVRDQIAARFPLDPQRQVLCGHSLGALFALYAMLHRPRAFDGYVLSSPSVWWGGRYAQRLLRRRLPWLCAQGLPALGVSLTVGAHEQGLGPGEQGQADVLALRQARAMVDGMHELAGVFAQCPGLRLRSAVLPGHTHRSAPLDALVPGWRWLLARA